jgi:hypothetical protein
MNDFSPSIIEYLGKFENGILVLVGLIYDGVYYESTFYYDDTNMVLTIPVELEEIIGQINEHENYQNVLSSIMKKVVPYSEMYNSIDPIDFTRWSDGDVVIEEQEGEQVKVEKDNDR